jgi:beta-glucosidase
VEADVRNVSQREGDEVVELYLSFPKSLTAPIHALRGFTRMNLGPGETKHVLFTLDARDLSEVNEKGDRIVANGAYRISMGGGQPGSVAPQAEAAFRINGDQRLPE